MLVHDDKYSKAMSELLSDAQDVSMAVAFWGAGSETIFKNYKGKPPRIICNLALGGTNPKAIRELKKKWKGAEIRQLDNLHAKLVLTGSGMIVGSANISSNGLGLEDGETAGFRELGIVSKDAKQLEAAHTWFAKLWKASDEIEESHLIDAQRAWEERRSARPWKTRSRSLLDMPSSEFQQREIYFVIYRNLLSKSAENRLEEEKSKLANISHPQYGNTLDAYEGWRHDELPKDPDAVIIPIHWIADDKVKIFPVQHPCKGLGDGPRSPDEGDRVDFVTNEQGPGALRLPFSFPNNGKRWKMEILSWLKFLKKRARNSKEAPKFCIPVHEFLEWREKQPG